MYSTIRQQKYLLGGNTMFQVTDNNKISNMTSDEFYRNYGQTLDPIYFRGAYKSHQMKIENRTIKIQEMHAKEGI